MGGGKKETDMFLVASEPCQEAWQVQDPSTLLHSPNPGLTSPHSSATHQNMPSIPTLLTLPQGSPQMSQAASAFNLGPQASPQYPGRPKTPESTQGAARALMEVTHLLCQLTQVMGWKVASGMRHRLHPGVALDISAVP